MVNKKERTLVIIKPDGIQRSLIGEVINRLEKVGLKLVAMKMTMASEDLVEKHYTVDENWILNVGTKIAEKLNPSATEEDKMEEGRKILSRLTKYMTSCPVVVMVWQGAHAASLVRKVVGKTEPLSSEVGTIRGDYVLDSYEMSDADERAVRNIIHASENDVFGEREIKVWFTDSEVCNYRLVADEILYDVNLDGLQE